MNTPETPPSKPYSQAVYGPEAAVNARIAKGEELIRKTMASLNSNVSHGENPQQG